MTMSSAAYDENDDAPEIVGFAATKHSRSDLAGIGFVKRVRKCSEHIYVRSIDDDSIFAGTDLSPGDEVISIDVPVRAMNAVEVARLVRDSEGDVTIVAAREKRSGGKKKKSSSASSRLLRKVARVGSSSSSSLSEGSDVEYITATGRKRYRTVEAGVGFRRCARKCVERMLVGDIEPESIFAGTDLRVDDEVLSVEVAVDGRNAGEVAELIRESEGEITIYAVPQHPTATTTTTTRRASSDASSKIADSSASAVRRLGRGLDRLRLGGGGGGKKSPYKSLSPAGSSTNTGLLTEGSFTESAQFFTAHP